MAKKPVKYCVVDAFTDSEFKGNPAAVCMLEDAKDDEWLQAVAKEFNLPITCFLTKFMDESEQTISRLQLRWFTTSTEVSLCGHGTLAAAYYLFRHGLVNSDKIEFLTLSGSLITKKVPGNEIANPINHQNGNVEKENFFVRLDFPVIPTAEFKSADTLAISKSLNGASVVEIHITNMDDILVVLPSGEEVVEVEPQFDQIRKFPGRAMVITGPAPPGSGFDFYYRVFGPNMGVDEDPVCGSVNCSLAPYWCKRLGKSDLKAYAASSRSGVLNLHLDHKNQKVRFEGKAILVAEGSLLV